MSDIETGGPAFPSTNNVTVGEYCTGGHMGMTMRDYFAAKAMTILYIDSTNINGAVKFCYEVADAMLAARGKP